MTWQMTIFAASVALWISAEHLWSKGARTSAVTQATVSIALGLAVLLDIILDKFF